MPPAGIPSGDSGNIQVLLQVFCTEEADINCERQRTVLDEFSWALPAAGYIGLSHSIIETLAT